MMKKINLRIVVILTVVLLISAFLLTSCSAFSLSNLSDDDSDSTAFDAEKGSDEYQKWMKWLKEFDEWMDSYIAILQEYEQNPSSPLIMIDYLKETAKLTEWIAKSTEIESDDKMTATEAMKVLAEYERILAKQYDALESIS